MCIQCFCVLSSYQLWALPPGRPRISSWRTGGWGLGPWSPAGCWTRACSSSWTGCWKFRRWSRWRRVCSGPAGGRSPCRGLTGPRGRPSPPPPSAHRKPAATAAECCNTWTTGQNRELWVHREALWSWCISFILCRLNCAFIVKCLQELDEKEKIKLHFGLKPFLLFIILKLNVKGNVKQ